ncbi:hypothetical protein [Caldalkalibacillus mannanilyticus]|uniref:hypothetical protein n=1 Tax=Caldalkalibacillus mannanilyticus TaxID=1418 RepID=UPI00046AE8F8|nr:hypothetical protein [Caldalkalibacillus mannanilyticus]
MVQKKLLLIMLMIALVFSTTSSITLAEEINKELSTEKNIDFKEYTVNYNGVEFASDFELTSEDIEFIYNIALNNNKEDELSINSVDGGGNSGTITYGPFEDKIDNSGIRVFIDTVVARMMKYLKLPAKVTEKFWRNWAFNHVTGWASGSVAPDHYVKHWLWEKFEYPNNSSCRSEYNTIVFYDQDFTFTKPKKVEVLWVATNCKR